MSRLFGFRGEVEGGDEGKEDDEFYAELRQIFDEVISEPPVVSSP